MEKRALSQDDVDSVWAINEEGLPGTGQVSKQEISNLLALSVLAFGVFQRNQLLGFVICLSPRKNYSSPNYAWFNKNFESFIYVDRIAVCKSHRNQGIGSSLYEMVTSYAEKMEIPVAAEVNLEPPNPGSMRFHHRFEFETVGTLHHKDKSVSMLIRS